MKKIDFYLRVFERCANLFKCPVCASPLEIDGRSALCLGERRHRFDFSARGYVNLCYPHKSSGSTYTKGLFESRKAAFASGFFDGLADKLDSMLSGIPGPRVIADMGCGEGSFLRRLAHSSDFGIGADLSKSAIETAASGAAADILWTVADLAAIPLRDRSVDVIINILSPSNYSEFARILKNEGTLIKVIPSGRYLSEIRELAFGDSAKSSYDNSGTLRLFENALGPRYEGVRLSYRFETDEALIRKIFEMTPLSGAKNFDDYGALKALGGVTADFRILRYEKRD